MKPTFVISDLHAGDGSCRDSFAYGNREQQFYDFLEYVKSQNGQLVVAGDLLELWQSNISKVITHRLPLLDKLNQMGAVYILGNHDADLNYFSRSYLLNHPLITWSTHAYTLMAGDKTVTIIHGHEADPYCVSDVPGIGRITAILTGIAEDKHGSPMHDKYETVASKVVGPMDRFVSHFNWLCGKPSRYVTMNRDLHKIQQKSCDILISGHTHCPGRIGDWYYNTGTWAEFTNSFVRIDQGIINLFDWKDKPVSNNTELPV